MISEHLYSDVLLHREKLLPFPRTEFKCQKQAMRCAIAKHVMYASIILIRLSIDAITHHIKCTNEEIYKVREKKHGVKYIALFYSISSDCIYRNGGACIIMLFHLRLKTNNLILHCVIIYNNNIYMNIK